MERLTKMNWLPKFDWPVKLEWLTNIKWHRAAFLTGIIIASALIAASLYQGAGKMIDTYSNWQKVYAFKCRDLRDNQRFKFRSDDPGQLAGKYQIRRGVYIDRSDRIKCEQRLIKGS